MTNEEIELKYFSDITSELVNKITKLRKFRKSLEEARTSERNRIIKEIEEYISKANTDLYGIDWVLTRDLLKQLNSLKQ